MVAWRRRRPVYKIHILIDSRSQLETIHSILIGSKKLLSPELHISQHHKFKMAPGLTINSYEKIISPLPVKALASNINGTTVYGSLQLDDNEKHDKVLRVFRCYIADLCEQFKGGHPG